MVILRKHELELKAVGMLGLHLFGSVARGDNTVNSDVHLLFESDLTQSDKVLGIYDLQDRVSEMLGVNAHLSSANRIRAAIMDHVLAEAIRVF